jgi:hypothetical protein
MIWLLAWLTFSFAGLYFASESKLTSFTGLAGSTGFVGFLLLFLKDLRTVIAQPLAKELKTYLRLPSYQEYLGKIPSMINDIDTLCKICLGKQMSGKNRRLVFFIEDLDRCGKDGIVNTFEAVRLVLGIEWVTVIIVMDQRIALPALACHYKELSEFHQRDPLSIARDYLAKVIQLPIRLSKPSKGSVARYLAHIWNDNDFAKQIEKELPTGHPHNEEKELHEIAEEPEVKPKDDVGPAESLDDIIRDINRIDVKEALMPEQETEKMSPASEIKDVPGFSTEQKRAFYNWLINFNLRNPRQIKRLYNSYNLLWSLYDDEWKENEIAWYSYMLALLALEMINEHVPLEEKIDTKALARNEIFTLNGEFKYLTEPTVEKEKVEEARKEIQGYQHMYAVNLLSRIEPFVLPEVYPQERYMERSEEESNR